MQGHKGSTFQDIITTIRTNLLGQQGKQVSSKHRKRGLTVFLIAGNLAKT
jgi:hypothetical protein